MKNMMTKLMKTVDIYSQKHKHTVTSGIDNIQEVWIVKIINVTSLQTYIFCENHGI